MSDQNYSAEIKLALQDQVTPVIDKIDKRLADLEKSFEKVEKSSDKTSDSFKKMGEIAGGISMEKMLEKSIEALKKLMDTMKEAIKIGLDEVEVVEKLGFSITGLVANTQAYTNAQGLAVSHAVRFNEALRIGKVVAEDFDRAESKLGLDTAAMGQAFLLNHARMSNANITLQDQIKLIEQLSTVGKAYNIDANSIPRQIQMLLSGNVGARNQLAAVLGITELKDITKLLDQIKPKVEDATKAVELQNQTWAGGLVLVKKAYEDVLGEAMKPLSTELGSFTSDLLSFLNKPEVKDAFKDMGKNLVEAFQQVKPIIMDILAATIKIAQFIAWLANQSTKGYGDVPQASKAYRDAYGGGDTVMRDPVTGMIVGKNSGYSPGYGSHYGPQTAASILDMDRGASQVFSGNGPHVPTPEEIKAWEEQKKLIKETTGAINELVDKSKAQSDIEDKLNAIDQERIKILEKIKNTYKEGSPEGIAATQKAVKAIQDIKERAIAEDTAKTLKAEQEKWDKTTAMATKGIAEGVALNEAAAYQERLQLASSAEDYQSYYDAIKEHALEANKTEIEATAIALRAVKKLREDIVAGLLENGTTAAQGVKAAMIVIFDNLKTETQRAFEYITGLFGDLGNNIQNTLYEALTGNGNALKNFFKGIADDFSKNLSKSLKDTIMPFFAKLNLISVEEGAQPEGGGPGAPKVKVNPNAGYYTAGAMALTAAAASAGADTFANGFAPYMGVASGIASASGWTGYGLVAAAVVAAVGAIVTALSPGQGERTSSYSGATMADAVRTGHATGTAGTDREVATSAALSLSNSMLTFFADIFSKADPTYSRDILRGFRDQMLAYFESLGTFGSHAGGEGDFKANIDKIFKDIIPKELMHRFFGQVTNMIKDPGGMSGAFGAPFGPSSSYSKVDEKSPLVQFLTNLGFSLQKVEEIAGQIDVMTPEAFQKYFSGIVGAVIEFQNNIKNLSRTTEQMFAEIDKAAHPDVVKQFKDSADTLVQTAADLSLYTGQDQIDKAGQLNAASAEYYNQALQALKALKDMVDAIANQANNFNESITMFLDAGKKNPAWQAADRRDWLKAGGIYSQQAAGTNDPNELQKIWNNFMADAAKQLKYLEDLYNQAAANLETMTQLAHSFDTIFEDAARNFMDINQLWGDYSDIQRRIATTSKDDAAAQLGIVQSTQQLYSHLMAFIQGVNSAQGSLTSGVAGDIWSNNYAMAGNNDKGGSNGAQIGMIKSKIQEDMQKIANATDPNEVTRYAGDIRGLLRTYQGFFKPGSGGYNEAFTWSNEILNQLQGVGTGALTTMGATARQIAGFMGTGGETMQTAQDLFQSALDAATLALGELQDSVTAFQNQIDLKLLGLADGITTQMNRVAAALTTAMENFTKALGADPNTGGGGNGPGTPGGEIQNLGIQATATIGDDNTGLRGVTAACNTLIATIKGA